MKHAIIIGVFTLVIIVMYGLMGQLVPQKITYPPEDSEISLDMTPEEMALEGEKLYAGKGSCLGCHTMEGKEGGRFPDLANIGMVAGDRIEGMSAEEYLIESMVKPDDFIVPGFNAGMTPAHEAPFNLNATEIKAITAYLQSLGGEPTITPATEFALLEGIPDAGDTPETEVKVETEEPQEEVSAAPADPRELLQNYACFSCHSTEEGVAMVGPSFAGMSENLSRAEMYEAILKPDATIAEGYPPVVMGATMKASGFFEKVSAQQLDAMVDYLMEMGATE